MNPKVIFLQRPVSEEINQAAGIHGDVYYLFEPDDERLPPPRQVSAFMWAVKQALEDLSFNPQFDIIVQNGRFNNIGIFLITVTKEFGNFRMLMWNPTYSNFTLKDIVGRKHE